MTVKQSRKKKKKFSARPSRRLRVINKLAEIQGGIPTKIPMVITIPVGLDTATELQMLHDIADIQKMLYSESDNKYDVIIDRPTQDLDAVPIASDAKRLWRAGAAEAASG